MKRWIHAATSSKSWTDNEILNMLQVASKTGFYGMPEDYFQFSEDLKTDYNLCERVLDAYFSNLGGKVKRFTEPLKDIFVSMASNGDLSSTDLVRIADDPNACDSVSWKLVNHPSVNNSVLQAMLDNGQYFYVASAEDLTDSIASQILHCDSIQSILKLAQEHPEYIEDVIEEIKTFDLNDKNIKRRLAQLVKQFPEYADQIKSVVSKDNRADKYSDKFFFKKYPRDEAILNWASYSIDNLDADLNDSELLAFAEDVADDNGWNAFETVNDEFESLYQWNNEDPEEVIDLFDYAYGNGNRLYPLDYSNGAQEAFYHWVKKYHPEADTSAIDVLFG